MRCPYCKTTEAKYLSKQPRIVCINCRNFYDAEQLDAAKRREQELFAIYWALPWDWQSSDAWMIDPQYLKANCPYAV